MEVRKRSLADWFMPWAATALVFALVLACYWPALQGGLVWDDAAHVTRPDLRSWSGLGRIWSDPHATQQYYPVLHSAFWIEHWLWGDATLGYHLANVLFHATSCCLLALVLQRLLVDKRAHQDCAPAKKRFVAGLAEAGPAFAKGPVAGPGSARSTGSGQATPATSPASMSFGTVACWLAALLFAVHPVCVESVAWISEQKNTLSLVFYLLAALAYLDFADRRGGWSYGRALAFFGLAVATKSVTATLPAALLVVLWWKHGKLDWRRDVVPLIPWFVAAAAAGILTVWVERRLIGAEGAAFTLSPIQRLLLAGRVVWFYLGKFAWPVDLMFVYPRWDVPAAAMGWIGCLAGVLAVTAGLWMIRRRSRAPLAGWLFFVGSLFPALGFFNVYPFLFSYVADHFQYLASLGPVVLVATGFAWLLTRAALPVRVGAGGLGVLLLAALAVLANRQSRSYRDGETLYRATLERNPDCWMAHINLASELVKTPGRTSEVLDHYAEALRLRPGSYEAHNNLANELVKLPGRLPEALAHFERALQLNPAFVEAHVNLANALATLPGRMPEALEHYHEALRLDPHAPETHYCLANTLAAIPGRAAEAQAEYEEALRLRPAFAEAHDNLAGLLAKQPGGVPEALAHFEAALRIRPDQARTHYNFALLLEMAPGRTAEAFAQYQEALRLDPDFAEAHNNLAILYAKAGQLGQARVHWETALRLKPDYEDARRNLQKLQRLHRQ
jgi:tetratricopeptide (TPR) repeat protein